MYKSLQEKKKPLLILSGAFPVKIDCYNCHLFPLQGHKFKFSRTLVDGITAKVATFCLVATHYLPST